MGKASKGPGNKLQLGRDSLHSWVVNLRWHHLPQGKELGFVVVEGSVLAETHYSAEEVAKSICETIAKTRAGELGQRFDTVFVVRVEHASERRLENVRPIFLRMHEILQGKTAIVSLGADHPARLLQKIREEKRKGK